MPRIRMLERFVVTVLLAHHNDKFLLSWILTLDAVPDVDLVRFLPSYIDGLLKILSDDNEVTLLVSLNYSSFAGTKKHVLTYIGGVTEWIKGLIFNFYFNEIM